MEFEISGFCSVLDAYAEIASQIKYISIIVGDFFYQTLREFRKFKKKKKTYGRAGLHRYKKAETLEPFSVRVPKPKLESTSRFHARK